MSTFKHFCLFERQSIQRLLRRGKSRRFIAKNLDRIVSSISDEVRNNAVKGKYIAKKADHKAYAKRKYSKIQCMKAATDLELREFIVDSLQQDQSPEGSRMWRGASNTQALRPYTSSSTVPTEDKSRSICIQKLYIRKAAQKEVSPYQ